LADDLDVVLLADAAAGADDHLGLGQIDPLGFGRLITDELNAAGAVVAQPG